MWYPIVVAALAVTYLLESTFARRLEMFMAPEDVNDFYIEEKGSKDIECYVLADLGITVSLIWSGPSINASKHQLLSNNPRATEQRVGNWLNITQFTDAAAGSYTCRAKTSAGDDLSRPIKILKSCEAGKYNPPDCTSSCSTHCKPRSDETKGRTCHHMSGACLYGCQPGYEGSLCTDTIPDDSSGLGGGGIAGIVLAILVVLVIVVLCCVPRTGKTIRKKIRTCLGWETGPGGGEERAKYTAKPHDEAKLKMLPKEEDNPPRRNGADGGGSAGGHGDVANGSEIEVKVEQPNKEPPAKSQDRDAGGDEISEEPIQPKVASKTMAAPPRAAGANFSIQPMQMEHELMDGEPLIGATAAPLRTGPAVHYENADLAHKLEDMKQTMEESIRKEKRKMEQYQRQMEAKDDEIQRLNQERLADKAKEVAEKNKQIEALTKERDDFKNKYHDMMEKILENQNNYVRELKREQSVRQEVLTKQRTIHENVGDYHEDDQKKLRDLEAENKQLEEELKKAKAKLENWQRSADRVARNKSASRASVDDDNHSTPQTTEVLSDIAVDDSGRDNTEGTEVLDQVVKLKDETGGKE